MQTYGRVARDAIDCGYPNRTISAQFQPQSESRFTCKTQRSQFAAACRRARTRRQHGGRDRPAAGDVDDLPGAGVRGARGRAVSGDRRSACRRGEADRDERRARRRARRQADRRVSTSAIRRPNTRRRPLAAGACFITTTNGTRALHHARLGRRGSLSASFLNLSAVVASVKDEPRVDILCAGTDGDETREDILAAGAIVDQLLRSIATARLAVERRRRSCAARMATCWSQARARRPRRFTSSWRSSCATRPAAAICSRSAMDAILSIALKSIDSTSCPSSTCTTGESRRIAHKSAALDARRQTAVKWLASCTKSIQGRFHHGGHRVHRDATEVTEIADQIAIR